MISQKPYVITIVGAESSGKSVLATGLASYFQASYVPEYARSYLSGLKRPYNVADLHKIAESELKQLSDLISSIHDQEFIKIEEPAHPFFGTPQFEKLRLTIHKEIALQNKSSIINQKSNIVIVDGGMLTLRMWAKIKFMVEIPVVEEALITDVTDLYLLCRPLPMWTPDPLREAPALADRCWIYNQYLQELIHLRKKLEIVDMSY